MSVRLVSNPDAEPDLRATLLQQLQALANEEAQAWMETLDQAHAMCLRITSDQVQPVGLQELARVLAEHIRRASNNAVAIQGRVT